MTVGDRIRLRRKELKLTQEELGLRLGLKKSAVCRLERAENNITTERVAKIAKALDTTPAFLMGWVAMDLTFTLDDRDKELIVTFHSFNEEGKSRILDYARDLSKIDIYKA